MLDQLGALRGLSDDAIGAITTVVQLGFIAGTLSFAILAIPDRFSPRKLFLASAVVAALANAAVAVAVAADSYTGLLGLRFITGFFLAGIYPLGMRIAAAWYREGLGRAIGYLVAALVLGSALPHLLKSITAGWSWLWVNGSVSTLALLGGVAMFCFVPDGPHLGVGAPFKPRALLDIFRTREFRASAFGYFGHMWELYAFWAFTPVFLAAHLELAGSASFDVAFWTFAVIAIGSLGCIGGGLLSQRVGSARVAVYQLAASGVCCMASPLFFFAPTPLFLLFLLFWGVTVIGDSPQFSTLNAMTAPRALVGSALTIANCIGFAITIVSIELLSYLAPRVAPQWLFFVLLFGPAFGLYAMRGLRHPRPN